MKFMLYLSLLALSLPLWAKRELILRASDVDGFPARPLCFISNNKMSTHQGVLLVKYTCLDGEDVSSELWLMDKTPKRLLQSESGNLLSDPTSSGEDIFIVEFNEGGSAHLWQLGLQVVAHKIPFEIQFIHDLVSIGVEQLKMRTTSIDGLVLQWSWHKGVWKKAADRGVSYYFSPGHSSELILQKQRLGLEGEWDESQPDIISLAQAPDFIPQVIAQDRDSDPSSKFLGFSNFSIVNGNRWLAIARTEEGDVALIGHGDKYYTRSLAEHFRSLDFWQPALTSDGRVVVRGSTHAGEYGLWILEEKPRVLLKMGDTLMTDQGLARVGNILFYNAPLVIGEKVYIGVGLEDFSWGSPLGQGIVALSID